MSASYRWKITKDHIDDGDSKGVEGPRDASDDVVENASRFSIYDDDDILYYEGIIYGDYDGFEPLDDFGTPNAGATQIKINGKWL